MSTYTKWKVSLSALVISLPAAYFLGQMASYAILLLLKVFADKQFNIPVDPFNVPSVQLQVGWAMGYVFYVALAVGLCYQSARKYELQAAIDSRIAARRCR